MTKQKTIRLSEISFFLSQRLFCYRGQFWRTDGSSYDGQSSQTLQEQDTGPLPQTSCDFSPHVRASTQLHPDSEVRNVCHISTGW